MTNRPDVERLRGALDHIEDTDTDTLAEFALLAREDGRFLMHFAGLAEAELRRRMKAIGVLELPTADVLVSIGTPERRYLWRVDELEKAIRPKLLRGEWEAHVHETPPKPPERKVATRPFLTLVKRRGLEAEALACCDIIEGDGPMVLREYKGENDGES